MRRQSTLFIGVFCLLFIASCSDQQAPSPARADVISRMDSTEKVIKEIKIEVGNINADTSRYRIVEKNIDAASTEGGTLTKLFRDNELRKAVKVLFGEMGRLTSEYYFKDGEIIFVDEKEDSYDSPIYIGNGKIKSTAENRFYFHHKKLIRWIGNDGKVVSPEQYADKEEEMLDDSVINDVRAN